MKRLKEMTTANNVAEAKPSGRMKVQILSAGSGSSGWYDAEVVERAATDQLVREGTHVYLDHPRESDRTDLPERSVRDLAASFTGPATYNPETQALEGEIQVVGPYRELLADLAPFVGLSIHGSATDISPGVREGRTVSVVEGLAAIDSVDVVTRAGARGKVLALMESAGVRPLEAVEAEVSHTAWSEFADSDFDDEQYARACVLDRGGDGPAKQRYSLPVREPSGTLNRNAVHAAAGMVGKVKGASDEAKTAAAKKLVALYRGDLDEDPPAALLALAGESKKTDEVLVIARGSDLSEAMVRDTEQELRAVLMDTYGVPEHTGDDAGQFEQRVYAWVRDFDPAAGVVFFELSGPGVDGGEQLYAQPFTGTGTAVALDGDRSEVRVVTTYVPATGSGSASTTRSSDTTTKESKEDTMEITEAEHARLTESAGRAETLQAELDKRDRRDAAAKLIDEAKTTDGQSVRFGALERRGLLADLPVTENGNLDVDRFKADLAEAVKEAADTDAQRRRNLGEGQVSGFGTRHQETTGDTTRVTESEPNIFGRTEKGA